MVEDINEYLLRATADSIVSSIASNRERLAKLSEPSIRAFRSLRLNSKALHRRRLWSQQGRTAESIPCAGA
jgi:hypothetical protein